MLLRRYDSVINLPDHFTEIAVIDKGIKFVIPTEKDSIEFTTEYDSNEDAKKAFEDFWERYK